MNDTVVVEVCNGGEGCADKVRGVGFVVASFPTYAVEELAAESEVGDEVDCWKGTLVLFLEANEVVVRLFMVSK